MLGDVLAPVLGGPVEALRSLSLPIGPAEVCAERLAASADAGALVHQAVGLGRLLQRQAVGDDGVRNVTITGGRVPGRVNMPALVGPTRSPGAKPIEAPCR